MFRKKSKGSSPTSTSNDEASSSAECLAQAPSSPGHAPASDDSISINTNHHKRSDAVTDMPENLEPEETLLSSPEPFPRYVYSMDMERDEEEIARIDSKDLYPTIVVTPPPEDR